MPPVPPVPPVIERIHLTDEPGCLFPADGITAHWHKPEREGPRARAGVICLPIQGGDYDVSTWFATCFAAAGYQALRFERRAEWLEADRDLEALAQLGRQYVVDVGRVTDHWIEDLEAIDPERLGLFGVSMGAGVGAIVSGTDPRVKAAVLCIGGADLADVVLTADDVEVNQYRRDLAARLACDEAGLRPHLEVALDPLDARHAAGGMRTDTTLFIAARFDHVVRWHNSLKLWEAIGRPRRWVLPTGHYSAVVFLPLIKWLSRRWFDRHLGISSRPS